MTFEKIILELTRYWCNRGALLQHNYDLETGAGTFNPATFFGCLGSSSFNTCYLEISKRPQDGRYCENPNRLQKFHQFQVLLKPTPRDARELLLDSLHVIGLPQERDFRFVQDDWHSPTQGATGVGFEVWCDGLEIAQFTYFQIMGGEKLSVTPIELTYGLERISMLIDGKTNVYDMMYNEDYTYGDVFQKSEKQWCEYNFQHANCEMLIRNFQELEDEAYRLLEKKMIYPAYDISIKLSHIFNLLDARSAISTLKRVELIHKVREISCHCASQYSKKLKTIEAAPPKKIKINSFNLPKIDDFLLEIGSEELPKDSSRIVGKYFVEKLSELLETNGISFSKIYSLTTPRRIAIYIEDLKNESPTKRKRGPKLDVAFHGNIPTKSGHGFFKSLNLRDYALDEVLSKKCENIEVINSYLFGKMGNKKSSSIELIIEDLQKMISSAPFNKKLSWEESGLHYGRAIKWILLIYGSCIIEFEIAGIKSSNITFGHFQKNPGKIQISHPKDYTKRLEEVRVIPLEKRKASLSTNLLKAAGGYEIFKYEDLLFENLYLSEDPIVAKGRYSKEFLELPKEVLLHQITRHQKYFPLMYEDSPTQEFLMVLDNHPNHTTVANNESSLHARLKDALFLYNEDSQKSLDYFSEKLKDISFHESLGSMYDKSKRIESIASNLANELGLPSPGRAALLCKIDIATKIVCECPSLQGIMGYYYTRKKIPEDDALAIMEHYLPRYDGDMIPESNGGAILSLADKIDNLCSYSKLGLQIDNANDPYSLRRNTISILKILIKKKWSLDISKFLPENLFNFVNNRLHILLDKITKKWAKQALKKNQIDPYLSHAKCEALSKVNIEDLLQIKKRLSGETTNNSPVNTSLLQEKEEIKLKKIVDTIIKRITSENKNYTKIISHLKDLVIPVNDFFDNVRINVDNKQLQKNRLALIQETLQLILIIF